MIFMIVNDLPEEFGERELIAVHKIKEDAKAHLIRLKGVSKDSYSMQYVKLVQKKFKMEDIEEYIYA